MGTVSEKSTASSASDIDWREFLDNHRQKLHLIITMELMLTWYVILILINQL